ncbi:hypothetical protein HN51_026133, partial [Arachis hypogaea]
LNQYTANITTNTQLNIIFCNCFCFFMSLSTLPFCCCSNVKSERNLPRLASMRPISICNLSIFLSCAF